MTRVVLDISRLISRVRHSTPSGVDRVEMAYVRGLLDAYGDNLDFGAVHPSGAYGRIRRAAALAYCDELERRWSDSSNLTGQRSLANAAPWITRLLPRNAGVGSADVLVQASPNHLHLAQRVRRKLMRERARFVCFVHDLIPIEFPEYARPNGAALHERRMATVAETADAVIVNSAATGASLRKWIQARDMAVPPIHVALLGTLQVAAPPAAQAIFPDPYFLCLGTIEPRKNHLLLLHIWRHMAETMAAEDVPHLVVAGRRGWENEQIVDMLERSPALQPFVTEINRCGDDELGTLIRGARALLMPSFAEGFGMPVVEALSVGTPVIASNLNAHREVGGAAPDFLDPLDGLGWQQAILDHARKGEMHEAQQRRITQWRAPDWAGHMEIAINVIEETARKD